MQNNVHVMVDIETYDVKPSAIILSIGACVITDIAMTFYKELDTTTQYQRTVSSATKDWWSKQPMPIPIGTLDLHSGLLQFQQWLDSLAQYFTAEPIIWCKGTDFDTAILIHAYQSLYLPVPWMYNNVRDCRTIYKVCGFTARKANHNALHDAQWQAEDLMICLNDNNLRLA